MSTSFPRVQHKELERFVKKTYYCVHIQADLSGEFGETDYVYLGGHRIYSRERSSSADSWKTRYYLSDWEVSLSANTLPLVFFSTILVLKLNLYVTCIDGLSPTNREITDR